VSDGVAAPVGPRWRSAGEPTPSLTLRARTNLRRGLLLAIAAALAVPAAAADPLPVAPPPREVRPDGTRDPAPAPGKAEDPAEVVDRIIANAKQASDQLAKSDAGEGTRATQATVLKDIDALLNPPDSPPKGGGGESSDMNKQDKSDGKGQSGKDNSQRNKSDEAGDGQNDQKGDGKAGGMPGMQDGMGGKGGMSPPGGMNPGGGRKEKDGQASGRRPRMGQPDKKDGKDPGGMATAGKGGGQQPMPPGATAKAGTPKDPPATAIGADGKTDRPPPPLTAQLPLADVVAKEVWGHLPERLRQQMTQHYREEFMPRYAGLLRQYYSSLANTPPAPR
jgi:hypothetical protein